MKDVMDSLRCAMARDKWVFGDNFTRIGNPFVWIDGDAHPYYFELRDLVASIQHIACIVEEYPLPKEISAKHFDAIHSKTLEGYRRVCTTLAPFFVNELETSIKANGQKVAQDYAFIKTYCKDLPDKCVQVDLGPGTGGACMYNQAGFKGIYFGVDGSAHSHHKQRFIFRALAQKPGDYLDVVECENFGLDISAIGKLINASKDKYPIRHVPSWWFNHVNTNTVDLVTATFMMNEINHAGVLWLISNATRTLKKGGYFYFRDSSKLKPNRHNLNYDKMLVELGFEPVARFEAQNRVNFWGIPRVFQKKTTKHYSYQQLIDKFLGKFANTVNVGEFVVTQPESKITSKG